MPNLQSILPKEPISIKGIIDLILELKLTENDSLLLHSNNFDDIALEYRETYKESIGFPYYLLNVLIIADNTHRVGVNKIGILKNSQNKANSNAVFNSPDESHRYDTIYRCGWCGNVVDFDGNEFDPITRNHVIKIYETYTDTIEVVKVNGECCREKQI